MDDLFQIGCVGLIKAIDNFDITQDVQFSTYRSSDDSVLVEKVHIENSKTIEISIKITILKSLFFYEIFDKKVLFLIKK